MRRTHAATSSAGTRCPGGRSPGPGGRCRARPACLRERAASTGPGSRCPIRSPGRAGERPSASPPRAGCRRGFGRAGRERGRRDPRCLRESARTAPRARRAGSRSACRGLGRSRAPSSPVRRATHLGRAEVPRVEVLLGEGHAGAVEVLASARGPARWRSPGAGAGSRSSRRRRWPQRCLEPGDLFGVRPRQVTEVALAAEAPELDGSAALAGGRRCRAPARVQGRQVGEALVDRRELELVLGPRSGGSTPRRARR